MVDSLTKKMGSAFFRKVLESQWSLSELGFQEEGQSLLFLVHVSCQPKRKFGPESPHSWLPSGQLADVFCS